MYRYYLFAGCFYTIKCNSILHTGPKISEILFFIVIILLNVLLFILQQSPSLAQVKIEEAKRELVSILRYDSLDEVCVSLGLFLFLLITGCD